MSKSVAVLSKFSSLTTKLKEVLPSVNFIDVNSTDISALQTSEIIVGDYDLIGPHIYQLSNTKWIHGTWAGVDSLLPHIRKDSPPLFPITRTSGDNFGQLMGEYVVANIIFWERNYFKVKENQRAKMWEPNACPKDHRTIAELTIGILGLGAIGSRIGRTLHYLGANIYGFGRRDAIPLDSEEYKHVTNYFTKPNLPKLLSTVDYVINVLPNTAETENLLGNSILKNCEGKNVVFINIGRGNVIKESELVEAIEKKWISGAILDVFEVEPLAKESKLWSLPNVFITPHISGNSRNKDIAAKFKINFEKYLNNEPLINQIDFTKGY